MKTVSDKRILSVWIRKTDYFGNPSKFPIRGAVVIREGEKPRVRSIMWGEDGVSFYGRKTPFDLSPETVREILSGR